MAQAVNDLLTSAKPNANVELSTQFAPIASSDRIQLLDVLRGFALFGVLVANIFWSFNGFTFVSSQRAVELTAAPIDAVAITPSGFSSTRSSSSFSHCYLDSASRFR